MNITINGQLVNADVDTDGTLNIHFPVLATQIDGLEAGVDSLIIRLRKVERSAHIPDPDGSTEDNARAIVDVLNFLRERGYIERPRE
jgi:hypothetical protein